MKWLHISDLHHNPATQNFDSELLLSKLNEYLDDHKISVDEIFYTGDFRFAPAQKTTPENARIAAAKLMEIAGKAGVTDPRHIHIVPGNHDLDRGETSVHKPLLDQAYDLYSHGSFSGSVTHNGKEVPCIDYLEGRFQFFSMVAAELNNSVWTDTPVDERIRYHRTGSINDMYNIVYLNTSLGCGWDSERTNLVAGYQYIAQALETIDNLLPTIVLGHHGIRCFTRMEAGRIKELFKQHRVRLYLCGDEHVGGIDEFDSTLQLTAGCLNQEERGVEPTFYIGNMDIAGAFTVKAYTYLDGAYPGWSESEPICKKIQKWTDEAFPPSTPTVFGRDTIIERITKFLTAPQGKIAEIWGVAGVGKTTVCNEVLKKINTAYIVVDTKLNSTTYDIQRDILRQLGVDMTQASIRPDEYATVLLEEAKRTRKTLYLDNAESPIDKDRDAFSSWLLAFARDSGWCVMYSTQTQLSAENIEHFPLKPLHEDDACNMFVSRRWRPEERDALSDEEKGLVREIAVRLLSSHPLAIILATSEEPNMRSLSEIMDDLRNRFYFELGDDPDNPHRSMSAALSMTVSRIGNSNVSQHAKELWSLLAQYQGILSDDLFSLAYDNAPEYNEARLVLRRSDLIGRNDYSMLEPIKSVAASFDQEVKKTSRRLLFHTLATIFSNADNLQSPNRIKWHDLALSCLQPTLLLLDESEQNNFEMIRPVVFTAQNYYQYTSYASLLTLRGLEQLYRTEHDNLGLANVMKSMGNLERRLGGIDAAQKHYADAEQLYRMERSNLGLANVMKSMGNLESDLGEIDAAQKHYADAERLFRTERDNHGLANVLLAMGDLESHLGEIDAAQKHYADAEQLYRTERHNLGLANVLKAMGDLECRLGEINTAQKHYADAEQLYRTERANLGLANVLLVMGVLESRLGEIDAAKKHYADAEQLYRTERANLGLANLFNSMGDLERRLGEIDAAQKHYAVAEQLYRTVRENLGLANVLKAMGDLESLRGEIDTAQKHYADAEQLYRTVRENLGLANVLKAMGDLESRLGEIDAAQKLFADAEQLYRTERDNLGLANVLISMGDLESRLGEIDATQKHYADAEQIYRTERDNLGLANVLQAMGDLKRRLGEIDAAIFKYRSALELYDSEREPIGRVYCLAELCLAYAKIKDEPHYREYAKATTEALGSVVDSVADYAIECMNEAKDIMSSHANDNSEHKSTDGEISET